LKASATDGTSVYRSSVLYTGTLHIITTGLFYG
jgi:hypothetical protein